MLGLFMYLLSVMMFINKWLLVQMMMVVLSFIMFLKSGGDYWFFFSSMGMGMDSVSYSFIFLSVWIMMLVVLASRGIMKSSIYVEMFLLFSLLLLLILVLTFSCVDFLWFYISFEMSLIPMLMMILGWGYQPERIQAGVYMLFYTLFASLPLLASLLMFSKSSGSMNMNLKLEDNFFYGWLVKGWYFCTVFAFLVKMPMFFVHLWLPKAHVEAPVGGSMVLAGVLLKLGGYGLMRVFKMFEKVHLMFVEMWLCLGVLGGLMVSMICLRQVDMKALIAYSSVAHMGMVLGGLCVMNMSGYSGAMILMVGHGLCSSGLFCIANMSYERVGSRSLMLNKGLLSIMPNFTLWWFLLSVNNMSAPPSLNLLGELKLIMSMVGWSSMMIMFLFMLCFFGGAYSLYLYSMSQHGKKYNYLYSSNPGYVIEYLGLMLHWVPLNLLFVSSGLMC